MDSKYAITEYVRFGYPQQSLTPHLFEFIYNFLFNLTLGFRDISEGLLLL